MVEKSVEVILYLGKTWFIPLSGPLVQPEEKPTDEDLFPEEDLK